MSRVLDEIVTSSGSDDDYINTSEEDVDVESDEVQEQGENGRQLFVSEDESPAEEEQEQEQEEEEQGEEEEDGDRANPWQFQKVIRKEINSRLPSNYNLKRWRKPSRMMIDSVMQLLESNGVDAIDSVFDKYEREIYKHLRGPSHLRHQEIQEIKQEKERMIRDILVHIEKKLRFSKFPARLSENDFNVEYIYEKRRFLQERYASELHKSELLEKEITRENKLLEEARQMTENLKGTNDRRLRDKLEHNDIHPSMLQAISEDLESKSNGNIAFNRDKIEVNLELPETSSHELLNIEEQVPSLQELNEAIRTTQNISNTLLEQTQLDRLNKMIL